ncbi:MAG: hypothetical protein ABS76_07255 [Pelagibacterium sp. SCN 64-44]|nr:MAG: hypothetical protein ABS76_07255 [Pelagibacterium sp. SCN 64-44]
MPLPLAALLIAQRDEGKLIETLPHALFPADLATAYQVQTQTMAAIGPVGSWKVQPYPEAGEPMASPLPRSVVFADGMAVNLRTSARLSVEAEVAVTLKADLPGVDGGYDVEAVREAIGTAHLAIEILASRFADPSQLPALVGIADLQNNGAVVVGPALPFPQLPEVGTLAMDLLVDGTSIGKVTEGPTTERTLRSLAWLANHAAERGLPLKAGDVVITGARIGALPLEGKTVKIEAAGFPSVSATFD